MRGLLVVSEVALAVMLLVGAGLMLKSFQRLTDVNPGFNTENLLTMSLGLQFVNYQDPAKQVAFFEQALQRVRSLPGVVSAGASTSLPPSYIQQGQGFEIEGRPNDPGGQPPSAIYIPATPDFLETLQIPLVSGRTITEEDTPQSPGIVVINRTLADRFFPNEDPLGRRMTLGGVMRTIVGVVGDAKYQGLSVEAGPQTYVPHAQSPYPGMRIVLRTTTEPMSLAGAVRAQIESVDPEESPTRLATMTHLLSESVAQPRFNTLLITLFALLAFVLSAIGIFGVINYDVTQRTNEIGVRMALGARSADVLRMVLRQGLMLTFFGLVAGLTGAFALTRFLSGLLFEVEPTDPVTYVLVAGVLSVVAVAACLIPARRATKVDPLVALRYE
jgi:putative ABC transport system permease protein